MEAISQNLSVTGEEPKKLFPWSQQPGEPDIAYSDFTAFLTLGPNRSIADLAKYLKKPLRTLYEYSRRYDWFARASKKDLVRDLYSNTELLELERHAKELQRLKIEMTAYVTTAITDLSLKFKEYWANYKNPEFNEKIKFMMKFTTVINRLFKLAEMAIPPELLTEQCNRNIMINEILGLAQNMSQVEPIEEELYAEHLNVAPYHNFPVRCADSSPGMSGEEIDDFLSKLRKNDSVDFPLIE